MEYQVIILPTAKKDIDQLTPAIREVIVKRLAWLGENAEQVIHHTLQGMPENLSGLCRFRVSDYRILYWKYSDQKILKIYRVMHRSTVYRRF